MKTREWLLIIFIVILLQFIVQVSAWLYGGNTGALGYVSFAGTVVSIILAVLAIVYSNFQSISQQNSAERISSQVEKLIGVTENIEAGKKGLVTSISHLNSLAQKVDESIAHQGSISRKVDGIVRKFESAMSGGTLSDKKISQNSTSTTDNVEEGIFHNPFSHGYIAQLTQCVFFYYGAKLGLTISEVSEALALPILRDIVKEDDTGFDAYNEGMQVVSWQFFVSHGYLILDEGREEDSSRKYSLNKVFERYCAEFVEYLKGISKEDEDSYDKMLIGILEGCESRLKENKS